MPITASLANITTPPGGTAQLQVFLNSPLALVSGSAVISLDPGIFDNIIAADVYSATGDQVGSANIQGRQVDLEFGSQTAGIGRLPGLPLLTITVPVLATATPGKAFSLSLQPGITPWMDVNGVSYNATVTSGTFTVGGAVSIAAVGIAGGLQPANSVVEIDGTGFTGSTNVSFDGVAVATTHLVSPQRIDVTLAAPSVLDFRRLAVQNPGSPEVSFFPVLHGNSLQRPSAGVLSTVQPIFPLELYPAGDAGNFFFNTAGVALLNPGPKPSDVTIRSTTYRPEPLFAAQMTVTLPPGSSYFQQGGILEQGIDYLTADVTIIPDSPLRMVIANAPNTDVGIDGPIFRSISPIPIPPTLLGGIGCTTPTLAFNATVGSSAPAPLSTGVFFYGANIPFTASVSTQSGGQWLSATPSRGVSAIAANGACAPASTVTISANPANLAAGTYQGSLILTPQALNPQPNMIPVMLTVYQQVTVFASSQSNPLQPVTTLDFESAQPQSNQITITSSADPTPITVTGTTKSGQSWLTPISYQGKTPATVTITFDPSRLTLPSDTGTITIVGPNNALVIPVTAAVYVPAITLVPNPMSFDVALGQSSVPPQVLTMLGYNGNLDQYTASVQTSSGGNWLSVAPNSDYASVYVNVSPAGLTAGAYQGTITITSPQFTAPAQATVNLLVVAPPNLGTISAAASSTLPSQPQANIVPLVSAVLNAGSQATSGISPGEILTIFGQNIGPASPVGFSIEANGRVGTNTGGVEVLFNGVAAPVLYSSSTQVNAIVPYEAISSPATDIAVVFNGTTVEAGSYLVVRAAPGIFTVNSAGVGTGAVLNQDNSLNSTANPAVRGSVIQIYATGEGVTSPAGVTGEITGTGTKQPVLPVGVTIGGVTAVIQYSGSAPGEVSGLFQVNAVVPANVNPGPTLALSISVGGIVSQKNVSIAVK